MENKNEKREEEKDIQDSKEVEVETDALAIESEKDAKSVQRGGFVFAAIIAFLLVWYLFGDRYTPYTTQARVQGYVVGVAPKVDGLVTDVWVENNQGVQTGDKLFQIDVSSYEIALSRAQSDYSNAVNQVSAGNAAIDSAKANLTSAIANKTKAERDITRLKKLYESDPGTVSVRMLEVSEASFEQAQAQVVAAKADIARVIEQNGGQDAANNSILLSAQTAVEQAKLDLQNTLVVAPSSGVITDLQADVGVFAGRGSPIMTLVPIEQVWVNAEFTENNLGFMKKDVPVEIVFDSLPGQIFTGHIVNIGYGVSFGKSNAPGSLPTIDNSRDWLRQSQRFPVNIAFDVHQSPDLVDQLRVGGQASVIAYTGKSGFFELLGWGYIRIMSFISYLY